MDCSEDGSATSRSSASSSSEATSSSEVSTSSAASTPGASPRGGTPPVPALALNRRVPPLSLGLNLAALPRGDGPGDVPGTGRQPAADAAPPASARRPKPVPALALPKAAPAAPAAAAPTPAPAAASQAAALLSLDMLSPAFTLERPAAEQQQRHGGCSSVVAAADMGRTCASRLGVPPERLRFYALTEVAEPQQLPAGCVRAAVEVLDSRFSLTALEQLLSENQQLATSQQSASAGAAEQASQLAAQLQQAQLENEALRQQLRRSESLRRKGQRALFELHQEFNALSQELMLGSSSSLLGGMKAAPPMLGRAPDEPVGTPAAVDDARLF